MPPILLPILLLLTVTVSHADGMPPVPDDYPSHNRFGDCSRNALERRLQVYNETRLDLARVLRTMADEVNAAPLVKTRLRGYADSLDDMRREMPAPDPDSDAFRNFDFRLGMMLTSMTLYLNTEDAQLTQRFLDDRDNPDSALGRYLARLDHSRSQYMDGLSESPETDCG